MQDTVHDEKLAYTLGCRALVPYILRTLTCWLQRATVHGLLRHHLRHKTLANQCQMNTLEGIHSENLPVLPSPASKVALLDIVKDCLPYHLRTVKPLCTPCTPNYNVDVVVLAPSPWHPLRKSSLLFDSVLGLDQQPNVQLHNCCHTVGRQAAYRDDICTTRWQNHRSRCHTVSRRNLTAAQCASSHQALANYIIWGATVHVI